MKTISLGLPIAAAMLFLAPGLHAVESNSTSTESSQNQSAHADRQAELIKRFDKNGDGKLDESERAEAKAAMRQSRSARANRRHDAMVKRYDKNGDGKLDDAERSAAIDDLSSRPRFIKRFDKDGDGKLSPEEKAAAKAALTERWSSQNAGPSAPASGSGSSN